MIEAKCWKQYELKNIIGKFNIFKKVVNMLYLEFEGENNESC